MPALFSGSGGSTTWIVSDIRGGFEVVFEELVRAVNYDGKGRLTLWLHGSSCNRAGSEECRRQLRWNGKRFVGGRPR